jgi:Mg2+-importing ATPase
MALATDAVDEELVATPRRWDLKSIVRFMLLFGLTGTLFDLTTFAILLQFFRASEEVFRTGWFLVSIMTGLGIILAVRTRRPLIQSRPGPWLLAAVLGVTAVVWSLPFTPLAPVFSLVVPTWPLVGMVLAISAAYVATLELGKWLTFRREAPHPASPHRTPAIRDHRD